MIIWVLFVEHIVFYAAGVFRRYDIENFGRPDINGIMRAPRERILSTIEIFVDCIIFGYIIKHMTDMTPEEFQSEAYYTYWIIIDCLLMFLTQFYDTLCAFMEVRGAILKNIYTLSFIQRNLLKSLGEQYLDEIKNKLK